ncbi:hypothetical protein [Halorubrum sp. DTA46]|uniref:hypothetical protein n=1 Tax=Halorubrum sp. DTA46 TaxID=3402162 RepID=UPI003AAF51E9
MSTAIRTPSTRVSALRALSIALAFAAVLGLIFGTAGFSAMTADRGLAVNVTGDESAYLGYDPVTDAVQDGDPTPVVEYRNQFDDDLDEFDVTVSLLDPEGTRTEIASADYPDSLPKGGSGTVDLTLSCPVGEDVDLRFEASGSGTGVSVSLDRVHTVTCVPSGPAVAGVQYAGVGSAHVESTDGDATVEAIVWLTDANPGAGGSDGALRSERISRLNTAKSVQSQLPSSVSNRHVAAIEFPEQGVGFFHPGWNGETHVSPQSGAGVESDEVPLDAETVSNTSIVYDQDRD